MQASSNGVMRMYVFRIHVSVVLAIQKTVFTLKNLMGSV